MPFDLEKLVHTLGHPNFLSMKGLANEVPLFIRTYDPAKEDGLRRLVDSVAVRLRNMGIALEVVDLFDLVLGVLEEKGLLIDILRDEAAFAKADLFETLQNYSDPKTHLVPRLVHAAGGEGVHLTLVTGAGRVFPYLRTHTILESLQPAMLNHPIVIFFPGDYVQDAEGGSVLTLFGSIPAPKISRPYYRATNLDQFLV